MTDKQIIKPRPICLYEDTCLHLKEKTRLCKDCVHHKNYWSELLEKEQLEKIKSLEQECEDLKETIKLQNKMQMEVCEEKNEEIKKLKAKNEELKDKLNCCFCNPYVELNDIVKQRKCVEVTECFRRKLDQLKESNEELQKENDKYSFFIEKLCDYIGLECDSEEQAMRTLSDFARQMNKI